MKKSLQELLRFASEISSLWFFLQALVTVASALVLPGLAKWAGEFLGPTKEWSRMDPGSMSGWNRWLPIPLTSVLNAVDLWNPILTSRHFIVIGLLTGLQFVILARVFHWLGLCFSQPKFGPKNPEMDRWAWRGFQRTSLIYIIFGLAMQVGILLKPAPTNWLAPLATLRPLFITQPLVQELQLAAGQLSLTWVSGFILVTVFLLVGLQKKTATPRQEATG